MKKISLLVLGLIIILILTGLGGLVWWNKVSKAPGVDETEKRVVITKGSSIQKIGEQLETEGIILSANAFKIYVQVKGLSSEIPAGQFYLNSNLKLAQVIDKLMSGPSQVWVTIPEGLRREEIAERIIDALQFEEFEGNEFRDEFLQATSGREGFLFPDTYLFARDVSGSQAASVLLNTFDKKFSYTGIGLSLNEVVTLASIIERETLTREERPIVAGIYMNRINGGWSLDADATLQFAYANMQCIQQTTYNKDCDFWPRPVTSAMKELNSQYNTYKNAGLPPGPIANAGLTSLEAAANPTETDFWFYLHDSDGDIHYAKTLEEHNSNIAKYLR